MKPPQPTRAHKKKHRRVYSRICTRCGQRFATGLRHVTICMECGRTEMGVTVAVMKDRMRESFPGMPPEIVQEFDTPEGESDA